MPKKTPSKNENLDTLDFIVNMLKEHGKDLDKLIGEVGMLAEQKGGKGELAAFARVEEKVNGLQNEVGILIKFFRTIFSEAKISKTDADVKELQRDPVRTFDAISPPVVLRCKRWEDFQVVASQSNTVSFTYFESGKVLESDALKNNQILSYVGEMPKLAVLLKIWLSSQLEISDEKIFEGALNKA